MVDKHQSILIAILNQCFSMTNNIPKHLNDPLNPQIIQLCSDLSEMLKKYLDEAGMNR